MSEIPPKNPREWGLFRFFIQQNVFLNIVYVGVFIVGLILWFFIMNREAFGNFDIDIVQVTTPFPGATAEEVEYLVTLPIENALKTLEGIDEMKSVSVEGLSVITLQMDPDAKDKRKNVRKVEREVDRIRTTDLPEDGNEPQVVEMTSAFPVLSVGVLGDVEEMRLREIAENLEENLLDIEGVSRVEKKGFKNKEIWVEADLSALNRYKLSLSDLIDSVRVADHSSPGGRLEIGEEEIIVRVLGKLEDVNDIKRVVVRANESGNAVLIKDVASVEERLERERRFLRLNGARAIQLDVLKKDSGDTLKIDKAIKDLIASYSKQFGPDIQFAFANEISFYIDRRLKVLVRNGMVGLVLVLIIMALFLSPQSAFWGASAIPFALLGGLIAMHIFGLTINLISLFAFILVSGMLVDNGIVVAEFIETKKKEFDNPFTAVSVGISEMAFPVFAAGLTTIIAFAPLAFMSGLIGKFLRQMPVVLIACLITDLLECLFILPAHLYHYDFKRKLPKWLVNIRTKAQKFIEALTEFYGRKINSLLDYPFSTLAVISLGISIIMFISALTLKFQMFPNVIDAFVISYQMPTGVNLKKTEQVALGLERIVAKIPSDEIEAVSTQIGSSGEQRRTQSGTNIGEVRVFLNKRKDDRTHGSILMDSIRSEVDAFLKENGVDQFELEEVRGGPPTGKAIELQIIGEDYDRVYKVVESVSEFLKNVDGVTGVKNNFDIGKEEIRLKINREAVARAGLTSAKVASVVRAAFDGEEALEIKRVGETSDIGLVIKLPEADRKSMGTVSLLKISNSRGQLIPIETLVDKEIDQGLLNIVRENGDRAVTITGNVLVEKITSAEVNSKLEIFLKRELEKYPGITFRFSGEKKDQEESKKSLLIAISISLAVIFLVLASFFKTYSDPFIIISVVPFALSGVFLAQLIPGEPITLLVGIGFVGLTGVVVNNSILLIETFKRTKRQMETDLKTAILEGSKARLRPIFLTTLSTFFGVMPLGYGLGGSEPFLEDMAYTFGWGLLLCSFITVFWVPSFYIALHKCQNACSSWFSNEKEK